VILSEKGFQIQNRPIGAGHPTYVIAELSANHGQNFESAVTLIREAKKAGADAIKVQTYTPDTITLKSDKSYFRVGSGLIWEGKTLYDLYAEAYTPWEWQPKLQKVAEDLGMDFFSSPFDFTAVDFLETMKVPAYKIASFETIDLPLLRKVAATGKPVIMSTGMMNFEEIEESVKTLREAKCHSLALLKCTSGYPADPSEMNLKTIPDMAKAFGVPVGLSDHTMGITAPVAAVALGACIIEKHFTLSRATPGPDSSFSLEPREFKEMVDAVRMAEKSLGKVNYQVSERESKSLPFRRSLFVVADVKAGEKFSPVNVRSIRPAQGLHTRYYEQILGQTAKQDIERGTPLSWDLVDSSGKDAHARQ
jgi:pseudaminic acid synthase